MKKRMIPLLLTVLLLLPSAALALRFPGWELQRIESRSLAQGLQLWDISLERPGTPLPRSQRLFLLTMKPEENPALSPRVVMGKNQIKQKQSLRDSMEQLAREAPALSLLAGVNGDFFDISAGGSLGLCISEGKLLMSSEFPMGWVLGFDSAGRARIGRPELKLSFSATRGGQALFSDVAIDALNCLRADVENFRSTPQNAWEARQDNQLVLYTRDWYRATMANDGGYEVTLEVAGELAPNGSLSGRVGAVHGPGRITLAGTAQVPQGTELKEGRMVLSATVRGASALKKLRAGDEVQIESRISDDWSDIVSCLGGGRPDGAPLLLKDGAIQPEMKQVADYAGFYRLHPRTAAAILKDGSLLLLYAPGYRGSQSEGLTIAELSRILEALGAVDALNLDGGGSSSMLLQEGGELISPDGLPGVRETPVGNCLILVERKP